MYLRIIAQLLITILLSIPFNANTQVQVILNTSDNQTTISRHIYGHFSEHLGRCIYDGFWVEDSMKVPKKDRIRLDIVEALKAIKIPNLRWPGGCFADEYHWRDGIGPRNKRPKIINNNWGSVTEDNSFGTHEFLELCSLLNAEPYIAANIGSGTVDEMSKWIEYLNCDGESDMTDLRKQNGHEKPFNVQYWGVGNENWGCGGRMTAEYYAGEFKRYSSFAKDYPNVRLRKIAGGANADNYHWTETLMKEVPQYLIWDNYLMWGISLHYYTLPQNVWPRKGSATKFDEAEYVNTMKSCLRMDELVTKHSVVMDKYDKNKRVALVVDEWGIWTESEPGTNPAFLYQQNSLRDALVAGSTLNIFNNHADRVRMANLAQTINVLQALILTKGAQMILTPTYHVFDMYQVHQDAKLVPVQFNSPYYTFGTQKIPALNVSASLDSTGALNISFVNLDPHKNIPVETRLDSVWNKLSGRIITSTNLTDHNTFEEPNKITVMEFHGSKLKGRNLSLEIPSKSIVTITLR